jgi:Rrf2 family protein
MNKLNRRVEYSLMALKYLQQKSSEKVTAKEVAEQLNTSFDVIARVLQILAQKGVLTSEHGVAGGYRLSQNLKDVSLFQLVEMIEGPTQLVKCITDDNACEIQSSCNIVPPMKALNNKLNDFYKTIPISDLIEDPRHV